MMEFNIQVLLQEILIGIALVGVLWLLRKMGINMRDVRSVVHEVRGLQHEIKSQVASSQ